jgi:hypothetical protein
LFLIGKANGAPKRTRRGKDEHSQERIAMVLRFFIIAAVAFVGLSLASSPAMAEEPKTESSDTIEQGQKSVAPPPAAKQRVRLSTRDRWRGKPYLRSSSDEMVRSQALDRMLPPANSAFNGGASFSVLSR